MKRLLKCLAVFLLLLYFPATAADISILPAGADTNEDIKDNPPATLPPALQKARELHRLDEPSIAKNMHIIIRLFPNFMIMKLN